MDDGFVGLGKRDLRALGGLDQRCAVVLAEDAIVGVVVAVVVAVADSARDPMLGDGAVNIVSAERGVAGGRKHLEAVCARTHLLARNNVENRHIKGAAAEVIDTDPLNTPLGAERLTDAVGERGGGRFIHNAHRLQSRKTRRIAGCLSLSVIEIGGHGDNRTPHRHPEVGLGDRTQFTQNLRSNFVRRNHATANAQRSNPARTLHERNGESAGELGGLARGAPHEPLCA